MIKKKAQEKNSGAQAIARAIDLLNIVSEEKVDISLKELSSRMSIPLSTAHRIAQALSVGGLLARDAQNDRFRLGGALMSLGIRAGRQLGLKAAHSILERIVEACNETAAITIFRANRVHVLAFVESKHALRVHRSIEPVAAVHATAAGKLFLAYSDNPAHSVAKLGKLERYTPDTITNPTKLIAEVSAIRERGYSINNSEMNVGVRAIAVPIPDDAGKVTAAISIDGPAERFTEQMAIALLPELQRAARDVARVTPFHVL